MEKRFAFNIIKLFETPVLNDKRATQGTLSGGGESVGLPKNHMFCLSKKHLTWKLHDTFPCRSWSIFHKQD